MKKLKDAPGKCSATCAVMPTLNKDRLKPIAVSMGDPQGIGREITMKAWLALRQRRQQRAFFVIDDPAQLDGDIAVIQSPEEAASVFARKLPVLALENLEKLEKDMKNDARAAWSSLDQAIALTRSGRAAALVTNPVSKERLANAGWTKKGQTEYLAEQCGGQALMMLAAKKMRVALVTTHLPLSDVPAAIHREKITRAGKILAASLRQDFGIARPHIAVAALNPHAGDGGLLGHEEAHIIAPACADLAASEGLEISGPYPADSLFTKTGFDAALCMYHDQALIAIKLFSKMQGAASVNMTLGLDIIRTSPDHGTAFDIAGKNIADPSSLIASFEAAGQMIVMREKQEQ